MLAKRASILLIFYINLFASNYSYIYECPIPYSIMLTIATVEKPSNYDSGYPYIISFNNANELSKNLNHLSKNSTIIDSRSIDCKSKHNCSKTLDYLFSKGIHNLDIGAFQLNSIYHKMAINDYFSLEKSYRYACQFILRNTKEAKVWSWESLARYNSKTKKVNARYKKLLKKTYRKLILSNTLREEK